MGWYRNSYPKITVEQCLIFSIFALKRDGILKHADGWTGASMWRNNRGEQTAAIRTTYMPQSQAIQLEYVVTENATGRNTNVCYTVNVTRTRCNFGGWRYWFVCPTSRPGSTCNRRVGKLYLPPGGVYFGCRHCYNLTYRSCQESKRSRMLWRLFHPGHFRKRYLARPKRKFK